MNLLDILNDNDPSAIADAIAHFYDTDAAARLSEGVKEEKKKYSWELLTKRLYKLFIP